MKLNTEYISVNEDLKRLQKELVLSNKQLKFVGINALNSVVMKARKLEVTALKKHIDRPVKYTVSGIRYRRWDNEKDSVEVYIDDDVWDYLKYQVEGGTRKGGSWGTERLIVPAFGQHKDRYGNLNSKKLQTVISRTRSGLAINSISAKEYAWKQNKRLFYGRPRGEDFDHPKYLGYYERINPEELEMLYGVRKAIRYEKRYPFGKATRRYAELAFVKHFERSFRWAKSQGRLY